MPTFEMLPNSVCQGRSHILAVLRHNLVQLLQDIETFDDCMDIRFQEGRWPFLLVANPPLQLLQASPEAFETEPQNQASTTEFRTMTTSLTRLLTT